MLNSILSFLFFYFIFVFVFRNPLFVIISLIVLILYSRYKMKQASREQQQFYQQKRPSSYTKNQYNSNSKIIDVEYTERVINKE